MISVYKADTKVVIRKANLNELLKKLPLEWHERANRYKFEADSSNFVIGRLLLKEGLKKIGKENLFNKIDYQESGKPILENVYFSISHTKDLVMCAVTELGEIGIDIEKVKPVELDDFESFFTTDEWDDINNHSEPLLRFYWYWTRKESIIKALGVTLSYLHQIKIDATKDYVEANGKRWNLKDLAPGDGYIGALCTASVMEDIKFIEYSL